MSRMWHRSLKPCGTILPVRRGKLCLVFSLLLFLLAASLRAWGVIGQGFRLGRESRTTRGDTIVHSIEFRVWVEGGIAFVKETFDYPGDFTSTLADAPEETETAWRFEPGESGSGLFDSKATRNNLLGFQTFDQIWDTGVHSRGFGIPHWFTLLITGSPACWFLVRQIGGGNRRKRGLCPTCAYDLRATPNRCPECGTNITTLRDLKM